MTLFLPLDELGRRKQQLRDPAAIGGLTTSLQRELHDALDVPVPDGKSRLTRDAGRCARCTVLLTFDPRSPYAHACPSCGTVYTDPVHHEWWLMNGHLWTAEQCTRAAALAYLLDDARAGARADEILATYTARYLTWPNRDNALGPTRPFFSTYLESIWLLHLATALDLRIAAGGGTLAAHSEAIDRIITPSAALIAGFDEGRSNRQVWHSAALLAAARILGDNAMRDRAAASLVALLRTGLHTDGSWYEGENYHLFAHRGLLSGITLAEQSGIELPRDLLQRFEAGFAAPFRTMLPDGTFPARRDSQYGIALRQYRTADWAECGFARHDSPELRAALASLYAAWPAEGDTHRWSSSADAERNHPGVRLTRADCSWRALLLARIDLPELTDATPHSELLEGQGLAVFRRKAGKFWVGLDYGDPGNGHGHPDRLNLVIATQDARWLDDVGTGSYTSPTLSWYRSSMAHNAPMVNGRDQGEASGTLLAYDEQGDAGWVSAKFTDPLSGVRFVRTVVVMADYVLDDVTWFSEHHVTVDIPMQASLLRSSELDWTSFVPSTAQDAMLSQPLSAAIAAGSVHRVVLEALSSPVARRAEHHRPEFSCLMWTEGAASVWRARTIGPPAGDAHGVVSLRQRGVRGRSVRVLSSGTLNAEVRGDSVSLTIQLNRAGESPTTHRETALSWWVERSVEGVRHITVLQGLRNPARTATVELHEISAPSILRVVPNSSMTCQLDGKSYRGTEGTWNDAGSPHAAIGMFWPQRAGMPIVIVAMVDLGRAPSFAPRREINPLDNELPDVNSDGVQLHWRSAVTGAWNSIVAVPDGENIRLTVEGGTLDDLAATWTPKESGFHLTFELSWPDTWPEFVFDLCVNERPAGRERRRGQLVLSGARGEFAYLRGARQSPDHALHVVFDPVPS